MGSLRCGVLHRALQTIPSAKQPAVLRAQATGRAAISDANLAQRTSAGTLQVFPIAIGPRDLGPLPKVALGRRTAQRRFPVKIASARKPRVQTPKRPLSHLL